MDVQRALKLAVSTGKVCIGAERAKKAVKEKKAKLVVFASNCPKENVDFVKSAHKKIQTYDFGGNNTELGTACGKPFPISMLAVIEPGESDIMSLLRGST
jgi:large subunit ribosomal protein L30e